MEFLFFTTVYGLKSKRLFEGIIQLKNEFFCDAALFILDSQRTGRHTDRFQSYN